MFNHIPSRSRRITAVAVIALLGAALDVRSQTTPPPAHDSDAGLIRVYANLLQIPVLILDPFLQPVKPIDPARFTIQFDDRKPTAPRLVRLEGDDPITLAVLIDRTHPNSLLPGLAEALTALTPGLLTPRDRVVLYETDGCHLRRHGELLPVQRALIGAYTEAAASTAPFNHSTEPCSRTVGLWRSAAVVANTLSGEPGRRILLAITNGIDSDRDFSAEKARSVATIAGVAIFSVAERGKVPPGRPVLGSAIISSGGGGRGARGGSSISIAAPPSPSDLAIMSEFSGGMLLETDPRSLPNTLHRFVTLVRGRYIVEFNRPVDLAPGQHIFTVSIGQPRYFIRTAGTSMPIASPNQLIPKIEPEKAGASVPLATPNQLAPPQITSTADTRK